MQVRAGQTRDACSACTAFAGSRRVASGSLAEVALAVRRTLGTAPHNELVIISDVTGEILLDWRGTDEEVLERLNARLDPPIESQAPPAPDTTPPRRRGRPRLGVVSREITLLPAHWEWLAQQDGGASFALRALVDGMLRTESTQARQQQRKDAAWRFTAALAKDLPNFPLASRALMARDRATFARHTAAWPHDIREHALRLAFEALD